MSWVCKGYPVSKVLSLCGLSPGSYYRVAAGVRPGRRPTVSTRGADGTLRPDAEVLKDIEGLLCQPYVDYGCRKVTAWLRDVRGWTINHKKVRRLMKEAGLLLPGRRFPAHDTLRARGCSPAPAGPGLHFEIDIKFIWVHGRSRHLLLLNVVDLFHREWMEFTLARSISHRDVYALVARLRQDRDVLIRTDNGGQFVAKDLAEALKAIGVAHEFIRPATPQQNAHVESFHAVLARALLNRVEFRDEQDARDHLMAFRAFYNHERIHSATCYYPPMVFLQQWHKGLIHERLDIHNRRIFLRAKGAEAPQASEAVVLARQ